jgi:hypothetical protein
MMLRGPVAEVGDLWGVRSDDIIIRVRPADASLSCTVPHWHVSFILDFLRSSHGA